MEDRPKRPVVLEGEHAPISALARTPMVGHKHAILDRPLLVVDELYIGAVKVQVRESAQLVVKDTDVQGAQLQFTLPLMVCDL